MSRDDVLTSLAAAITVLLPRGPTLVGIDGIDAAGKTTLADELVTPLRHLGRHVVRASIDGFHNPREQRLARGTLSPEGYFRDSFDYVFLVTRFLRPAKDARSEIMLPATKFDVSTDRAVSDRNVEIRPDSIVLFDGIFLFRPELIDFWDYRIFVDISFDTSLARGIVRDADLMGGKAAAKERYLRRYIPGQKLYLDAMRPADIADAIIRNDDPANRRIVFPSHSSSSSRNAD